MTRIGIRLASAEVSKTITALPFRRKKPKRTLQSFFLARFFRKRERLFAGKFEEFPVPQGIRDVKAEVAGLPGAKKFAGTAELQIGFGDLEAIVRAHHGFQARTRFLGHPPGRDKDAM